MCLLAEHKTANTISVKIPSRDWIVETGTVSKSEDEDTWEPSVHLLHYVSLVVGVTNWPGQLPSIATIINEQVVEYKKTQCSAAQEMHHLPK